MPHADVVVIGAGLAGLVAAARLAEAGAIVTLVAKGHASTHWGSGGLDVAGTRRGRDTPPRASLSSRRWTTRTASSPRTSRRRSPGCSSASRRAGCPTRGPSTRRSGACRPPSAGRGAWRSSPPRRRRPCGRGSPTRSWSSPGPRASRTSGRRPSPTASGARPSGWARTARRASPAITVDLDGVADRNNLNALHLARRFDDPGASGPTTSPGSRPRSRRRPAGGPGRVAVPAIVGLEQHAEAWAELSGEAAAGAVRDPARPAQHPGHPPLARPARAHPRRRRARAGRRGRRADPRRGRPRHGRRDGGRRAVAGHPHRGAGARHRRHRGRRARGHATTVASSSRCSACTWTPPSTRSWLVADALDPAGHPIEAAGIRHRRRPPAAGPATAGRRPSPTSGSRERSSPASGRSASAAATGSPSPAAGGRRTSWPRTPRGPRSNASRSP